MLRKVLLISVILLCSCQKQISAACNKYNNDNQINLRITAENDDIIKIQAEEVFTLPYDVLMNEEWLKYLKQQLDNKYYLENNLLIKRYNIIPEQVYSFQETIKLLKKEKYNCE